ncbi:hypothetical protein ACFQ08_17540, partial [Streptosporangium algeriense]
MSTKPWLRITVIAAATAALALPLPGLAQETSPGPAQQKPGGQASGTHDFQAEEHEKPDLDNRRGTVPPPASLAKAANATIRWNSLGTPAVVTGAPATAAG